MMVSIPHGEAILGCRACRQVVHSTAPSARHRAALSINPHGKPEQFTTKFLLESIPITFRSHLTRFQVRQSGRPVKPKYHINFPRVREEFVKVYPPIGLIATPKRNQFLSFQDCLTFIQELSPGVGHPTGNSNIGDGSLLTG